MTPAETGILGDYCRQLDTLNAKLHATDYEDPEYEKLKWRKTELLCQLWGAVEVLAAGTAEVTSSSNVHSVVESACILAEAIRSFMALNPGRCDLVTSAVNDYLPELWRLSHHGPEDNDE